MCISQSSTFNIEYAIVTGCNSQTPKTINLSKEKTKTVEGLLSKENPLAQLKILNADLSLKLKDKTLREPIGYIMRGDFSQARGHGMGLGVI